METNIKIVTFGKDLFLNVKRYELLGEKLTPKQIQTICYTIGKRFGIAAVPYFYDETKQEIFINSKYSIPQITVPIDNWSIRIQEKRNCNTHKLDFRSKEHRSIMADLYKRSLLINIKKQTTLWTLESNVIFYQTQPFKKGSEETPELDVNAYRRFQISEIIIEDSGLGFAVNISTAFFANQSVEDYFASNNQKRFEKITNRQFEQQGTLLYKGPNDPKVCYFKNYPSDMTLKNAPALSINGTRFENPYDYYRVKHPKFKVNESDKVAFVSFRGLDKTVPVPANKLYARLMNNVLPRKWSNLDKISPENRKKYVESFWNMLGRFPFGVSFSDTKKRFFEPPVDKRGVIDLPPLIFGEKAILKPPKNKDKESYKEHYRLRKKYLETYGCYHVPNILIGSKLVFVFPKNVPEEGCNTYQKSLCEKLNLFTKNKLNLEPIMPDKYENYLEAIYTLKNQFEPATVLFIFDDEEPAIYSNINYELDDWKLKRATSRELIKKFKGLVAYQKGENERGKNDWDSYIEMTALDVLQQMGCIPYIIDPKRLNYGMYLHIDVSEDYSHYSLSLRMFKEGMTLPIFDCVTKRKTDKKLEIINEVFLKEEFEKLICHYADIILNNNINNLLVSRDGNNCGDEFKTIKNSVEILKKDGKMPLNLTCDFIEYHKSSRKEIRIWENDGSQIDNILEGSYFKPNPKMVVIATTGAATISQGTSDPIVIVNSDVSNDFNKIIEDNFLDSQFNFSSPKVAQRLTLIAKRADDQLREKREQEIKRIR